MKPVTGRRIGIVCIGLVAFACGCDSKPPVAAGGSATSLSNVSTTSGFPRIPSNAGPTPSADPLSTFHWTPPLVDDLAVLHLSPAEVTAVQEDARKLNDAFYAGDFETVVRLRNPRFIEKTGGPEAAVEKLREQLARTIQQGVRVESFEMHGQPKFVKSKIREYALIPTKKILSNGANRVERVNFEFGSREIGNPTWTYVDGAQLNASNINTLFPDFPANRTLLEVLDKRLETRK